MDLVATDEVLAGMLRGMAKLRRELEVALAAREAQAEEPVVAAEPTAVRLEAPVQPEPTHYWYFDKLEGLRPGRIQEQTEVAA